MRVQPSAYHVGLVRRHESPSAISMPMESPMPRSSPTSTRAAAAAPSFYLIAVLDRDGAPVAGGALPSIGDRVPVQSLTIASGNIVAETVAHRPSDGLCCPTAGNHPSFCAAEADQLVPRQALVIESPLPGETVASGVEVRGTDKRLPVR